MPKSHPKSQDPPLETPLAVDPVLEQLATAEAERDALKGELLRVMAEAQNIQRRMRQQAEEARKFAAEPLVRQVLPVLDNFERTIRAAEEGASPEAVLDGVRAVDRQLRKALEAVGVARIESVGGQFDPHLHEAIDIEVSESHDEDAITAELEPGYSMHGRVIRPARVRVAHKP